MLWGGWRYDCVDGRLGSVCWKNLSAISEGVDFGVGNCFFNNLGRCVSNESSTLFWWDHWLGRGVLNDRFSRLFD
jgi:hypothetical protein